MIQVLCFVTMIIGIFVPFAGAVILLFTKEHSRNTTYLVLISIVCIFMNAAYFLELKATTAEETAALMRLEYLSNVMFFFLFAGYLFYFLKIRYQKITSILFGAWGCFEIVGLVMLWSGDDHHLIYEAVDIQVNQAININDISFQRGQIYSVRYWMLISILFMAIMLCVFRLFRVTDRIERINHIKLVGCEVTVELALILNETLPTSFSFLPVCCSAAVLFLVLSIARGRFGRVTDLGINWIMGNSGSAYIITDSSYGFLEANNLAFQLCPELEELRQNQTLPNRIYSMFREPITSYELSNRLYAKSVSPIYQSGVLGGFCMLLTDETERFQLMNQIEDAKQRAEDANEAKSAFMSNMSHEIRTPMNAIVGMTEILLREKMPDRQREYLNNIKNSGNALLTIINDILDFSKIESGKMEIIPEEYEPMSMFSDLSMIFLNRIGEKPVELLYDISEGLPERLYGDSKRLRQIIINLMNNAIKFTEEGSVSLCVSIAERQEKELTLLFEIRDTGQGIRKEDLGKLFGSYSQVDTRKNHHKEGTGLGLAISRQLVELMGGEIGVESVYGEGSVFHFTVRQSVVSENKAAIVKNTSDENGTRVVSAMMNSRLLMDRIAQLCSSMGVTYLPIEEALQQQVRVDTLFLDGSLSVTSDMKALLKEWDTGVYQLQNPMLPAGQSQLGTLMNKPLYSLNFAQALNRESMVFKGTAELREIYVAPQATVLVVDDNEMNRKVAKGLLAPLELQIDTATNGKEALAKIKTNAYDLVLMDHMMPIMDGIEACKRMREDPEERIAHMPVIALSANATVEAREMFRSVGMDDFVAKPIRYEEICSVIRKYLPEEKVRVLSEEELLEKQQREQSNQDSVPEGQGDVRSGEAILPVLEGIDVQEGIANSGSYDLWLSLLADFYKLLERKAVKIEKCLADGLLRDYTIEVHALKNTSRMIGAMELSEEFYELEQLGNAEDEAHLLEKTPVVLQELRALKPVLAPYGQNAAELVKVPVSEIRLVLSELKNAVDSFDIDAADVAMKRLEGFVVPEEVRAQFEDLGAYVADIAMEEIMTLCDRIEEKLKTYE